MPDEDPVLESGKRLSELKVVELKKELDKYGLPKQGNKNVLFERLKEYLNRAEEVTSSGALAEESVKDEPVNPFVAAYKSEQEKALKRARQDAEQVRLSESDADADADADDSQSANTTVHEPETKRSRRDSDQESTASKKEEEEEKEVTSAAEAEATQGDPNEIEEEKSGVAEEDNEEEREQSEEPARNAVPQKDEREKSPEDEPQGESEEVLEDPNAPEDADEEKEEIAQEENDVSAKREESSEEVKPTEEEMGTEEPADNADDAVKMVDAKEPLNEEEMTAAENEDVESGSVSQEESSMETQDDQKDEAEENMAATNPEEESQSVDEQHKAPEESSEEAEARHSEEPVSSSPSPPEKESSEQSDKGLPERYHNEDELDFDEEVPNGSQESEATMEESEEQNGKEAHNKDFEEAPDTIVGGERITVDGYKRSREVSPARHRASNVIHISGLTRPLNNRQFFTLLSQFGDFDKETDFWMNNIKTDCFVQYKSVAEAALARYRLHYIQWPSENKKGLRVDFSTCDELLSCLKADPPKGTPKRPSLGSPAMNLTVTIENKDAKRSQTTVDTPKSSADTKEEILARRLERFKNGGREEEPSPAKKRKEEESQIEKPPRDGADISTLFRKTETTPPVYYLALTDKQVEEKEQAKQRRPSR
ncbi:hypothetical protein QR680_009073 [Steinernema hermaphroditum]|uniref:SAP domain-containing protein n=1 Tax=Steinernema hermaphroditum TaxID=289476 RepID=A0AA39M907_9BILA|nr:hypothetical protein QR680_009073 [Steinernema hermaphroditum]